MSASKIDQLISFLKDYLHLLDPTGGSGAHLQFPNFDLTPFDYLDFAEEELTKNTSASKINCVSHLKRAVECEMDTFMSVLNIDRGLNFPKKLDFVGACGIVSARSLARMNAIRNKVEHEYAVPDLNELEVYFDLASSFVHAVEGSLFMLGTYADMQWRCFEDDDIRFSMEIILKDKLVKFTVDKNLNKDCIVFGSGSGGISEYAEGVKAYLLLIRFEKLINHEHVIAMLETSKLVVTGH